jgi:hypothetical protein
MAVNFIRWNPSTHIYELSTNDGASFAALPLNASIINEGSLADARLSSNIPLKDGTNAFTGANSFATNPLDLLVGQLKFPATQNPSANANTLDDYKKLISWTPVITFATPGNLAITYSSQIGRCVKIGNLVIGRYNVATSAFTHTTASGGLMITGLPFAHITLAGSGDFSPLNWQGITKAGYTSIMGIIGSGASAMTFNACGSGVAISPVSATDTPSGGNVTLQGSFAYEAAA